MVKTINFEVTVELPDEINALLPDLLNEGFVKVVEYLGLVCHIERGAIVQKQDVCDDTPVEQ